MKKMLSFAYPGSENGIRLLNYILLLRNSCKRSRFSSKTIGVSFNFLFKFPISDKNVSMQALVKHESILRLC